MHAYWSEGADIGDDEVLLGLVAGAGLDRAAAERAIADETYVNRVLDSTRRAHAHGINAIPAFVLDDRLLVMGAQPHATFEEAMTLLESTTEA
jgi:predicted DsbA family dithiol-disulfide isomerase